MSLVQYTNFVHCTWSQGTKFLPGSGEFCILHWRVLTTDPGCRLQILSCSVLIQTRRVKRVHWPERNAVVTITQPALIFLSNVKSYLVWCCGSSRFEASILSKMALKTDPKSESMQTCAKTRFSVANYPKRVHAKSLQYDDISQLLWRKTQLWNRLTNEKISLDNREAATREYMVERVELQCVPEVARQKLGTLWSLQ